MRRRQPWDDGDFPAWAHAVRRLCSFILCLGAATAAPALEIRQLSVDGGNRAQTPSLTVDPRAGLVLTWQTRQDDTAALHFALLDAQGVVQRRGEIARGRDWFVNWADFPSLAVLDNGDWVSFWLQKSGPDTYAYDIQLTRSTDQGRHWGAPIKVHDDGTASEHGFVSLLPAGADQVQVVWLDGRHTAGGHSDHAAGEHGEGPMSLRGARVDRRGRIRAAHELDALTCSCCQTDAARLGNGALVVYRDRSRDEVRDISSIRLNARGSASAAAIVHPDGWRTDACPVNGPAVAANAEQLITVWPTLVKPPLAVQLALGQPDGGWQTTLLEQGETVQGRVDAAAWRDGFVVSWIGAGEHASALKLARVDASGKPGASMLIDAIDAGRHSGNPRLAVYQDVVFLAWTRADGAGGSDVVLARVSGLN